MPLFGNGDWLGSIIWFILIFVMIFFYPRLMITQMLWRLEQTASMIEGMTSTAKRLVIKRITKSPSKELREAVNNFLEFFMIEPVSLDPFGIVKKIEHLSILSEKKFKYFVRNIAPKHDSEFQANLVMGLSGAISLNQIAKIVRHFIEMIKKTRNLQLALILQMQMPFIERISKALLKGTEALTYGWPIGDSVGPLVATHLIGTLKAKEVDEETLLISKKIKGKNVYLVRAKGPGGRLGKLGKVVERLVKTQKIAKIITIDAAAKLEGEKTGALAEGVGVAIGGIGVDRSYIENISTEKDIPLDSVVIKMSPEESIMPMRTEILNSVSRVVKLVEDNVARTKERGKIIVVGVGNTCGIGNDTKNIKETEELIRKNARILKQKEEEEKKKERKFTGWIGI